MALFASRDITRLIPKSMGETGFEPKEPKIVEKPVDSGTGLS
jgi:hypothetical protein